MTGNGYCDARVIEFLIQCMAAHCSIAICGCSGSGKTELLKYLTQYIPAAERTVTIEDVLEIHYQKMNPNKDCVEMRVAENRNEQKERNENEKKERKAQKQKKEVFFFFFFYFI